MNIYWHTNYKASQGGAVTLRYALRPHKGFEAAAIKKFGPERSQPSDFLSVDLLIIAQILSIQFQ
jgi:hypothetical protein